MVNLLGDEERLRSIGCDYGQGYFFSKPITSAAYEKLLDSRFLK